MNRISILFLITTTATVSLCHAATIKLRVMYKEGGQSSSLAGASVKCWDEDYPDGDDRMTDTETTDSNGRVELTYNKKRKSTILNPTRGWDNFGTNSNPDIYCRIEKDGVFTMHTPTKYNHNQDKTADFGTIYVYPDRVDRGDPGPINGCGASYFPSWLRTSTDVVTALKKACNNHDLCYVSCRKVRLLEIGRAHV